MPKGIKGFQKGASGMKGKDHPMWKGGKPFCKCGKQLTRYGTGVCRECYFKNPTPSKNKGKNIQTNTGRTHFKKGRKPWNKGKKIPRNAALIDYDKRQRGATKKKPNNFSEIMRKVNPPKGIKIKYDYRDKDKKIRVWRKGYVWVYKPDHPSSRKILPDYGYIAEHRYVIEKIIGKTLQKGTVVHHIDGDKSNNKLENLVVCKNNRGHNQIHTAMETFVEKLIRDGKVYYDIKKKEFCFKDWSEMEAQRLSGENK